MKLSAYLKDTGMTYAQFAKKIGMPGRNPTITLSRYANRQRLPRKDRAMLIVNACEGKVTLDDLYGHAPLIPDGFK